MTLYDDGRFELDKVDASESEGWMYSKNVGGYITGTSGKPESRAQIFFIDGNNKKYHLKRVLNQRKKEFKEEIKVLRDSLKSLDEIDNRILADAELLT